MPPAFANDWQPWRGPSPRPCRGNIHFAETCLRRRTALCGGFAKPIERRGKILFHAFAEVIHKAEIVLRLGIALGDGGAASKRREWSGQFARTMREEYYAHFARGPGGRH